MRKAEMSLPKGPIVYKYVDFRDNEDFAAILFTSPYAGAKCVHKDTRIYDPALGKHVTIGELYDQRVAPTVLAYSDGEFVPARASVPFKKGKAHMFEVRLPDGRAITVTRGHRFLTGEGWKDLGSLLAAYHAGSPLPLVVSDGLLPSSWDTAPAGFRQDALRLMRKDADSQFDYLEGRRFYDEPLHRESEPAQDDAPLLDDVRMCSHRTWTSRETRPGVQGHNFRVASLPFSRLSSCSSVPHHGTPSSSLALRHDSVASRPQDCIGLPWESPGPHLSPGHPALALPIPRMAPRNLYHGTSIDQASNTSVETIADYTVVYKGYDDYYDLTVPHYENYLAEGFINHNSTAMVDSIIRDMQEYPGCRIFLIGATLTALKRTTIPTFLERSSAMEVTGSDKEAIYRMPTQIHPLFGTKVQSELRCLGLDRHSTEAIEELMKSTGPFRVYSEEANTISSDAHDILISRARQFAFHHSKTVYDMCVEEGARWGILPEDAHELMKADKLHPVHQFELKMDDPMPGRNYVKSVMNPDGNDHMWLRFVGKLHPIGKVTRDWAEKYIGIRDLRFDKEERDEVEAPLIVGNIVLDKVRGHRGYLKNVQNGVIHFIDGHEAPEEDVDLVMQLYTIYGFSDENESRSGFNHQNSLLMRNRGLRAKAFTGKKDPREGLVFKNFLPEPASKGGHILPFPKDMVDTYMGIGGVDQGGGHATAALMAMLTKSTNTAIICFEYVRSGESARETAYTLQSSIPSYLNQVRFGLDPAMWNVEYMDNVTDTMAEKYRQAGLMIERGKKGDDAFDDVVDALYFRDDIYHGSQKADLYVYDNCPMVIEAMSTVTWADIRHGRHKWIVDVADAVKLMWSMRSKSQHVVDYTDLPTGTRVYSDEFADPRRDYSRVNG